MATKFRFRVKELIKEKEERDNRPYTYGYIARKAGIHADRVRAYAENDLVRFDAKTIEAFLDFFECSIHDIFEDLTVSH